MMNNYIMCSVCLYLHIILTEWLLSKYLSMFVLLCLVLSTFDWRLLITLWHLQTFLTV